MTGNAASDWALPVTFYFRVEFQSKFDRFQTSFTEVSGLDMQLTGNDKLTDTGIFVTMPGGVKYGKITLKRPIQDDPFRKWIYECLKADKGKRMIPYDMIIKLLDKDGNPLAAWNCSHAYPTQWTLSGLASDKSALAMETVVMGCNRIDYVK